MCEMVMHCTRDIRCEKRFLRLLGPIDVVGDRIQKEVLNIRLKHRYGTAKC